MNEMTSEEIPAGKDYLKDADKNFWENLSWHTLFCLLEKEGNLKTSELAAKCSLSVKETVLALESMVSIGIVKRTDEGYRQSKESIKRVVFGSNDGLKIATQYVHSINQVAGKILECAPSDDIKTKCVTYNSNKTLVMELFSKIQIAVDDFKQKSDNSQESWDGVYNLSASVIKMTGEV